MELVAVVNCFMVLKGFRLWIWRLRAKFVEDFEVGGCETFCLLNWEFARNLLLLLTIGKVLKVFCRPIRWV